MGGKTSKQQQQRDLLEGSAWLRTVVQHYQVGRGSFVRRVDSVWTSAMDGCVVERQKSFYCVRSRVQPSTAHAHTEFTHPWRILVADVPALW